MPTLKDWVNANPIEMTVLAGPYESVDDDGWKHDAYRLRLTWKTLDRANQRTTPEFAYRMGVGHRVPKYNYRTGQRDPKALAAPPLDMVIDSLISDASCYDDASGFEDFAASLGYDTDSRKAESIYRACGETLYWLTKFVGGRAEMEKLMYEIERL